MLQPLCMISCASLVDRNIMEAERDTIQPFEGKAYSGAIKRRTCDASFPKSNHTAIGAPSSQSLAKKNIRSLAAT